jgi:hypothetical protein
MGYQHPQDDSGMTPNVFVCPEHAEKDINSFDVDYEKEHPEWLEWILTDESWEHWRNENPDIVKEYKRLLEGQEAK